MSSTATSHRGRRLGPEKQFLLLALPFGLAFALVFPPFSIADEPQHFLRAWSIAAGRPMPQKRVGTAGDVLPVSLSALIADLAGNLPLNLERKVDPRDTLAALGRPLDPATAAWVDFRNTAVATPLPYLPAATAIAAGQLLGATPLVSFYLARLASLAAACALLFAALRAAPTRRVLWTALALLPMTLGQIAALSADGVNIGLAFLWTALVARACWGEGASLDARAVSILTLVAAALCATKLPYVLLVLLAALIPAQRFVGVSRAGLWTAIGLAGGTATALSLWGWRRIDLPIRDGLGLDTGRQLREIFTAPLHFAFVLAKDSFGHGPMYGLQFLGSKLGWLDAQVPWIAIIAAFALLLWLAAVDSSPESQPTPAQRACLGLVLVAAWTAVAASQYVTFTPYRQPWIEGLQGRYLLPLAPAGALLFQIGRFSAHPRRWTSAILTLQAAILGLALYGVVARYYLG